MTDVLVVGFGAAGAATAIEAREQGAQVLVADRFSGGGSSRLSGGVIYLGGGTPLQKDAGYSDTPESMYRYLSAETDGLLSAAVLRAFCAGSIENFEWLRDLGVPLPSLGKAAKTSYPPDDCTLYFSGNELAAPYSQVAAPAPRGHRVLGRGLTGNVLFRALSRAARERGVEVLPHTVAEGLVRDRDGRVIGVGFRRISSTFGRLAHRLSGWLSSNLGTVSSVAARALAGVTRLIELTFGRRFFVRAQHGVVLAAGGFVYNPAMMRAHAPRYAQSSLRLGNAGDTGSGIALGLSAGGVTDNLERCCVFRFINPPVSLVHGVLVDAEGERICNEELYGATLGKHMVERHGGRGWLLLDADFMAEVRHQLWTEKSALFQRVFGFSNAYLNRRKGRSLAELEERCGMRQGALEQAVKTYNDNVVAQVDPTGKSARMLRELSRPPFFAVNVDIDSLRFLAPCMTLGGLRVDGVTQRVVRADGSVVDGLYAVGRTASGVCSSSYVSGLSLADCIFSGRNAGRHAVAAEAASADEAPLRVRVAAGR